MECDQHANAARHEPGALLRHVGAALRRLASVPECADDAERLNRVAGHAAAAAELLVTARQDSGGAAS
ncbi:hypothetical protein [Streptomyces sp. WG7]|uniref:hypothetical protein n=1 Tax=Streptomyces sp. WG7 TaxID=3417650 RepID=UPI003CED8773